MSRRTVTSGSAAIRSMSQPRSPMRLQARCDRAIADGNAAFGEFRHEPAHGYLGLGRDPLHEPAPFSNEIASPMATHLPTRGAARPAKPLRPTHDTRHAHREGRGNCSHAASSRDTFCNSFTK